MKKKKKRHLAKVILSFFLILLIACLGLIGNFYLNTSLVSNLRGVYEVIPLPIVYSKDSSINITSRQLFQDLSAVRKFYESNNYSQKKMRVDFNTPQGKLRLQIKEKEILNKLIENAVVQQLAKRNNIKVTKDEIDKGVEDALKVSQSNYRQLSLNLKASYGWDIDDFKKKIVEKQLYLKKIFLWYQKNLITSSEYQNAVEIREQLKSDGSNFMEIAKKESEGESARLGGEISWINSEQIIPEVASELKRISKEEISNIIISPLGMHIVWLEDKREKKDDKTNKKEEEFKFKQIFIRGISFMDWLQKQKKQPPRIVW